MNTTVRLIPLLVFACPPEASAQEYILCPDAGSDAVTVIDPANGTVLSVDFITDGVTHDLQTPIEVVLVNSELWVTDQTADSIFRFDLAGNWIATIDGTVAMLDNIRGGCFANNTFYVSNDGGNNGAPVNSIVMFDTAGNRVGDWDTGGVSPFDVFEYNGELLVADFMDDTIRRFDYAGSFLGDFHVSNGTTGINSVEQLAVTSSGNVLAGGFTSPAGVYEYDPLGVQVSYFADSGVRGVHQLDSGDYLFTNSSGLHLLEPGTGTISLIDAIPERFLSRAPIIFSPGGFSDLCNGDGGDQMGCTPCACGNEAPVGTIGGCLNSAFASARLTGSGSASVSALDPSDLRFDMSGGVPASFAVLTSGDAVAPQNMANPCFGQNSGAPAAVLDGLRCAVQNTQRHGGRPVDAAGEVGATTNGWGGASGPPGGIAMQGGFLAGNTRTFQAFYRELPGMVCLTEQNTTQAVRVVFEP